MNVIDLLHSHGFQLKRVASTNGGEYAGPCPRCEGHDRFRVWPQHSKGTGGRFWCRRCDWNGDALKLIMDLQNLSFPAACRELGLTGIFWRRPLRSRRISKSEWEPKERREVHLKWRARATAYVEQCHKRMMQSHEGLAFAAHRGLKVETLDRHRIGWNDQDRFELRQGWGLKPGNKVWLPRGLVLPGWRDGELVKLKTRRPSSEDGRPKYVAVSGGEIGPFVLNLEKGRPVLVVEGEIDGLLCSQEGGDLVTTFALGAAQIRPNLDAWALLQAAPVVLCALDYDKTGAREWRGWWSRHVRHAVRWPTPSQKDPGDYLQAGGNIREWIKTGLTGDFGYTTSEAEG